MGGARVALLGVDATDVGLLHRWAEAGELPTFARLFRYAAQQPTVAPPGLFVGATWPTVASGVDAGRHRYYTWLALDEDYGLRQTVPAEMHAEPLWRELSRRGLRSAVLDVPHHRPDPGHDGIEVEEWGCHDRHHGVVSHPPELLAELDERFGRHFGSSDAPGFDQHAPCDYRFRDGWLRTDAEEAQLLDLLVADHARKRAVSLDLLGRDDWDLFVSVMGENHCVGHHFWHVHDPSHPRHDIRQRARLGDPLLRMYRDVDATVGAHLDALGPDALVFVLAAHGMGPHYDGTHLLDVVLQRLEAAHDGSSPVGWRSRLAGPAWAGLGARGRRMSVAAVRHRMRTAPPRPPELHPDWEGVLPVDRSTRRCFVVPNNSVVGAVRANVVGRDRHGLLGPGAELDAWLGRVEAELRALVNIDTGGPVVRDVYRCEANYERAADDGLPDLFVDWERSAPIERVYSPTVGTIVEPYRHFRTGDHHPGGMLWALGPGVRAGRREGVVPLTVVAPTIAAALGVELPDADGTPRPDLLGRAVPSGSTVVA